jgi:hypothetical protein
MKPIMFRESNVVFAKNQETYLSLPAYRDDEQGGRIFHCWKLSLRERLKVLLTGRLWINVLNFHQPPQPILPMVDCPFLKKIGSIKRVVRFVGGCFGVIALPLMILLMWPASEWNLKECAIRLWKLNWFLE